MGFQHEQRSVRHESRTSLLRTTKNIKTKNPWSELKKTNSHWRAKAAFRLLFTPTTVNTDRIHVSPSKLMILERDKINLMASFRWRSLFLLDERRLCRANVCLTRTTTTLMKTQVLKSIMRRIGPRNAPNKTPVLWMKQLKEIEEKKSSDEEWKLR